MNNRISSFYPPNNRISSFYPPNNGEYISPFTAPAMPNLTTQGTVLHKPVVAEAAFIPRSPLSPQKLAKLANALGISTPLPASSPLPSASKKSFPTPRLPEEWVTPESKTATPASATSRSRYLIHIVPPKHFPHESRKDPEAFAAFRRGSVVPLHTSLQGQIGAIAREFQLPTTLGVVLYLVTEPEAGAPSKSTLGKGPRLNEDVWKWLWTKVAEEQPVMSGVGLGFSNATPSPGPSERPILLRKHSSPAKFDFARSPSVDRFPLTPSPSTPSTSALATSPLKAKHEEKSEEQESEARQLGPSQYDTIPANLAPDTPPSSLEFDPRLLPGLGSPSILPVLAKVEFDIDRKVGAWYDAWSRSRKSLQKRKVKNIDPQGRLQLRITINNKKGTISPLSSSSDEEEEGYKRLSDSPDDDELTAGASPRRGDPLADMFGTDGQAWSDMQSRRPNGKTKGDLALDGASLSVPQDPDNDRGEASEDEVLALWQKHNQSQLRAAGLPMQRAKVPAPLNLGANGAGLDIDLATATPTPLSSGFGEDGTRLPYLTSRQDSFGDDDAHREKRAGGIYDDIQLELVADLDIEEHRAKQLKVREELDVLERNLAQFSPRALKSVHLSPDIMPPNSIYLKSAPAQQTTFSSTPQTHHGGSQSVQLFSSSNSNTSTGQHQGSLGINAGPVGPPVFRQPTLVGTPSPEADSFKVVHGIAKGSDGNVIYGTPETQATWPAVSYSALVNRGEGDLLLSPTGSFHQSLKSSRNPNSPPKVVLNGKTKLPSDKRKNSSISSMLSNGSGPREASESKARMKQYEEEAGFYNDIPKLQPSLSRRMPESIESPVLPLSPDPFGRFPSSAGNNGEFPPERSSSLVNRFAHSSDRHSTAPSSRFSVDSAAEEPQSLKVNKSSNLVSMKSFRKLWRKNDKAASPDPSSMPSRPPSSATSARETETDASRTPSPSVPFPSGSGREYQKPRKSSRDSGLDPFYFDQELKYTSRQTPSPQMAYQFPPSSGPRGAGAAPTSNAEKKRSMRKSLVSKWKNGSEGTSSMDSASGGRRRRRPSILDMAGLMRSGGGSISSTNTLQSPSVPDLPAPAEYRMSQHSGMQSRGSVSTVLTSTTGDDRGYVRRKPATQASTDSSQESMDNLPTPVSAVPPLSFAKGKSKGSMNGSVTLSLASPGDASSDGMRSSFDESQFEIVSPRVDRISPSVSTA